MKILAPISNPLETEDLIKAGADELYCGLLPAEWNNIYTIIAPPNRREYYRANLSDWSELKEIVDCASGYGVDVVLALNVFYSLEQYPLLLEYAKKALSLGAKGLMVADMGFFFYLLNKEISPMSINISTVRTVLNSETIDFFKSQGAKRITLPRHISLDEIRQIVLKNPDMHFEVFVLNDGCKNIDGFCTFHHGVEELKTKEPEFAFKTTPCHYNYDINNENFRNRRFAFCAIRKIKESFQIYLSLKPCAACCLFDFIKWGVYGVKIAGRQHPKESRIKDIQFIKTLLTYLDKQEMCTRGKYTEFAKELFWEIYKVKCNQCCYYFK